MKKLNNPELERNNPCHKEQEMVQGCLHKNGFIHEKCETYFENYKSCKTFWYNMMKKRRRAGIRPHMPDYEEREKIRQEFMASKPTTDTK